MITIWKSRAAMTSATMTAALCLSVAPVFGALPKDETKRINESATVLKDLRDTSDKSIPDAIWDKAQCVVVIPSVKKAAFIVGGEHGAGVMSCRHHGGWTSPIFMELSKGSVGFQIGAEAIDLVLVVMNQTGVDKLLRDKVALGGDASIAAGPVGRSANAATDAQMSAEMLAYSRAQGLFAGIDLSGGVLRPDKDANSRAYGASVTPRQVFDGAAGVKPLPEARVLTDALRRQSRPTSGIK